MPFKSSLAIVNSDRTCTVLLDIYLILKFYLFTFGATLTTIINF